jgi:hypothetical protein
MDQDALTHCYVDDSIHDALGFVALAFVFSAVDLDDPVRGALVAAGLDPEREEFKSRARMDSNPAMQAAREKLLDVIGKHAYVGVVIARRRHHLVPLGKQCLQALQSILIRNGIPPRGLTVHVDENIFSSPAEAMVILRLFRFLAPIELRPCEASHRCRGIQAADLIAHTFSQVVREGVTGSPKLIDVGGPDNGYAEGTMMPLSEFLLATIRYKILARRLAYEGEDFDPATDPVIIGPDDDPVIYGQNPEALGWGVQVAQETPDPVRQAVFKTLDRIWLGCMH